jgi:hypothetical protein
MIDLIQSAPPWARLCVALAALDATVQVAGPAGARAIAFSFEQACHLSVEGIVSKRADAPYAPGNRGLWVKVQCLHREEFGVGARSGQADRQAAPCRDPHASQAKERAHGPVCHAMGRPPQGRGRHRRAQGRYKARGGVAPLAGEVRSFTDHFVRSLSRGRAHARRRGSVGAALRTGSAWRSNILRRPRRCLAGPDTKSGLAAGAQGLRNL